jgi:hypothetical protein
LTNHFSDLLDRPMFHPPADSSRLNGLFRLPLGYQMDASYFYLKLKWNAQTRRITFTEAPAKYTSNTSATFRSNLTSAANGSGSSIDTCATLCSIRCKVGRHFVDALAADQVSRLASYFCTPLSSSCKPWELLLLLLLLHSQRFDKHFGLFMSPTCT